MIEPEGSGDQISIQSADDNSQDDILEFLAGHLGCEAWNVGGLVAEEDQQDQDDGAQPEVKRLAVFLQHVADEWDVI